MIDGPVIVVSRHPVARRRLAEAAERLGREAIVLDDFTRMGDVLRASAVVVDLDVPGADAAATIIRERWPEAMAAAFISMPDRERWDAANQSYDLVANRGSIAAQLTDRLPAWQGPPKGIRISLFEERDVAGRLGLVHRAETSAGPVAVYRLGSTLCAVADVCPHAGARLSEGTITGGVITCPLHGSQFDVCSGERMRGPADDPIRSFPIVVKDGMVFLELEDD